MKHPVSRFAAVLVLLVVVLTSAFAVVAEAFPQLGASQQLPVRRARAATVSTSWEDSTQFYVPALTTTSVTDTLRIIDLSTVNWHGANAAPGVGTNAYTIGALHFTATGVGGSGDSLTVKYQCSIDGSIWGPLSAIVAGTGTAGDAYYKIPLIVTPNTVSNVQPFLTRYLRVIVFGDTGGPMGGIKAYWTPLVEAGIPTAASQ